MTNLQDERKLLEAEQQGEEEERRESDLRLAGARAEERVVDAREGVGRQLLDRNLLAAEGQRLADAPLAREQRELPDRIAAFFEQAQELRTHGAGRSGDRHV